MLTVENGTLVPILTLSVEDYLLGVVPYEMSDSFPLEALKAQAVCARTYALSHLNASRAYDVVDTTNDQVFKGVDSSTKTPPAPCRRRRGLSACTTASWRNAFTAPATADRRSWSKMCGRAAATTATTQWLMTRMIGEPAEHRPHDENQQKRHGQRSTSDADLRADAADADAGGVLHRAREFPH